MRRITTAAVLTHRRHEVTAEALDALLRLARERGRGVAPGPEENRKHGLEPGRG